MYSKLTNDYMIKAIKINAKGFKTGFKEGNNNSEKRKRSGNDI